MTRAHLRANWIGPPSLSQPLLAALLHAFAMLVLYAASVGRMRFSFLSGACHTEVKPETLPEQESGIPRDTKEAAASSQTTAQRRLTCAPPTPLTTDPVFPPTGWATGIPTGIWTGRLVGGCNSFWNSIANLESRLRTDIARI